MPNSSIVDNGFWASDTLDLVQHLWQPFEVEGVFLSKRFDNIIVIIRNGY